MVKHKGFDGLFAIIDEFKTFKSNFEEFHKNDIRKRAEARKKRALHAAMYQPTKKNS